MRHKFEMPTNNEEFLSMLKTLKVKNPDGWVSGEFNRDTVVVFLLLWDLWDLTPNPNEAEKQLSQLIGAAMRHRALNPKVDMAKMQDESIDIFRKWLKQGIDPKDIVTVMRESQIEAIYGFLQLIDQADDFNHGITRNYGLFEVNLDEDYQASVNQGAKPIEDELSDKLQNAMPVNQPDMPRWC